MVSSYLPRLSEYSKFDEFARKAAMAQQAETITGLNTQFQNQAAEIESLKKQLDDLKKANENPQSQVGSTGATSVLNTEPVITN